MMVDAANRNSTVRTDLHQAVHDGLVNQVETFIEGYDINTKDIKGQTLLHHACFGGSRDMCHFLLSRGADINIQDNEGKSPLHIAYIRNKTYLFEDLFKNGTNVNAQDNRGVTVLYMACSDFCEIILQRDPSRNVQEDRVFQESVDFIGDVKILEIIKLLIWNGADVNIPTKSQNTALKNTFNAVIELEIGRLDDDFNIFGSIQHLLHEFRNKWLLDDTKKLMLVNLRLKFSALIKVLVKGGADCNGVYDCFHNTIPNSTRGYRCTLLHVACLLGYGSVIHILLDGGANACRPNFRGVNCLHYLLTNWIYCKFFNYDVNIIRKLLDSGLDINLCDKSGCTFLNYFVSRLNFHNEAVEIEALGIEVITELIDLGADVCAPDDDGNTPLHRSPSWGISKVLLDHGADINARCMNGETPIYNVIQLQSNCKHFDEFVKRNALVDAITNSGQSLLHSVKSWSIAAKLVEKGLDINLRDHSGNIPLFYAIMCNRLSVVEGLLNKKADVNNQNIEGQTVLHWVVHSTFSIDKYGRMLLDHGALASIKDNSGCTQVDIALSRQFYKHFLKYLIWMVNGKMHPYMIIPTVGDEQVELYRSKCEEECERLKGRKYGQFSLYNVLGHHRNPVFVVNKLLRSAIFSPLFKQDFPLYAAHLEKKLIEAQEEYCLLQSSKAIFTYMSNDYQTTIPCQWFSLPEEMKLYILSYLNNRELKFLVESMILETLKFPDTETLPS